MTPDLSPIARQVWDLKYRLKHGDGRPVDNSVEETWQRVATALAMPEAEAEQARWREAFLDVLRGYRFLPGGRILAGAGTERRVTLFNCFVMGTIPDSMDGIFEHLKQAALTLQQGGGIGYDFSTLRPKGAPVSGVASDASGPLSFMDVWDSMCRTIMSAGARRGAMMGCLRCDHPDIEAFIDAKRDGGRLRMFNLSVLVTDAFMAAVEADGAWDLVFDGVVHHTVSARGLWDRIMRATYAYAEPGVIFIDRVNARNNLHYAEDIRATNPCVTGDTWVMTADGPRQAADLVDRPAVLRVNGDAHRSGPQGFFVTGRKPVLRVRVRGGPAVRLTADHPVRKVVSRSRATLDLDWRTVADLQPGDAVMLHDHRQAPLWPGEGTEAEGYLLGQLIGDGVLKRDAAILSVWGAAATADGTPPPAVVAVMQGAREAAAVLPHRSDFDGWSAVTGRPEWRLKSAALKRLAERFGLRHGHKMITPSCEAASGAFCVGLLRGLFDADGSVQGGQEKGVSIRLAQSDTGVLEAAQRILLRLGIRSALYLDRRTAQRRPLPDGRGGHKDYNCRAQHELVIAKDNLHVFADRVGFLDADKATCLRVALASYQRTPNRERFMARVESITPDGEETVYDVQVPGIHAFDANGFVVHNCGEQPLPAYGTCLLGAVNLAVLVRDPFTPQARLDEVALTETVATAVRMLDNVIDVSGFPLPEQKREAEEKRRIGLGVTGLADALIMVGLRYGAEDAVAATERWLETLKTAAYRASIDLAREKGPFPLFEADAYLSGETVRTLPPDIRAAITTHGIRNALLTTIAPTGTISLFAGNVSSGIEPVYSRTARRRILQPDGSAREEEVSDYAFRMFRRLKGEDAPLPDAFVDVATLSPRDHLVMQAAAQRHIDSAISKTINLPEDIAFDAFKDVYWQAYRMGCKGCTTFRPNAVTGSVLSGDASPAVHEPPAARPQELPGTTYKLRWPESEHAIYVTVNDIDEEAPDGRTRRRPFEVFINSKNMEHYAWTVALTRMISAVFRRGGDVAFVVEELKAVFDPRGGAWMDGRYVPSLLAAIGDVIEKHMIAIGFLDGPVGVNGTSGAVSETPPEQSAAPGRPCPRCGQRGLLRQENCDTCVSCGYSKCS